MTNDDDAPQHEAHSERAGRWSRARNDGADAGERAERDRPDGSGTGEATARARRDGHRGSGGGGPRQQGVSSGRGFRSDRAGRSGGGRGRDVSGKGGQGRSAGNRGDDRDRRGAGRPARHFGERDSQRAGRGGTGAADRSNDRRGGQDREVRGPRAWDRSSPSAKSTRDTRIEPPLPEDITGKELDRSVWRELRTLTKENAEGVAKHLVAAATLLEEDPDLALAHAEHAARRAGRVAAVREALGLVHYRRGEFADAIREFRTAKRLSGSNHLLPYLVDCERGLGRYERALDLAASPEAKSLGEADNIELAIVISGVRRDLGQPEAAQMVLRIPALERGSTQPWAARLFYAYAEALLAAGDDDGARRWFGKAVDADVEGQTDAADRLLELDGLVFTDALDEDQDETEPLGPSGTPGVGPASVELQPDGVMDDDA